MAIKLQSDHGGDEEGGILAEINITPLTDIFLVLLIIFMVTSSVMSQMGVDVNLPKASATTAQAQPEGVIITLLPKGEIRINDAMIPTPDALTVGNYLKQAFSQTSSRLVILEGDREAFLGSAIQIMDWARLAGAEKFAIATAPENSK